MTTNETVTSNPNSVSRIAAGMLTEIPIVWQAAKVITVMVIAAPSMLMVEPSGIDTE